MYKFGIEIVNMSIMDVNLDYLLILKFYIICVCVELNFKFNDEYVNCEFKFDIIEIWVVDEKI